MTGNSAWKYYCTVLKGPHPEGEVDLKIGYDFPVSKQHLGSLLCGYYVCEHLRIAAVYKVNREDFPNYKEEWEYLFQKDMKTYGTDHVISDMSTFLRREVFHIEGQFFDKEGSLAEFPLLSKYERFGI